MPLTTRRIRGTIGWWCDVLMVVLGLTTIALSVFGPEPDHLLALWALSTTQYAFTSAVRRWGGGS